MQAVRKFELVPLAYSGDNNRIDVEYWLVGDELTGNYVDNWILNPANTWGNPPTSPPLPLVYGGRPLSAYSFEERVASSHFIIKASYEYPTLGGGGGGGPGTPQLGSATFTFDLGTDSTKVVKSIDTLAIYPGAAITIGGAGTWQNQFDHNNAINVSKEGTPEGVEILVPFSRLSVEYVIPRTFISSTYLGTLAGLVAKTNSTTLTIPSSPQLQFAPGTILFNGSQIKTDAVGGNVESTSISLTFSFRPNRVFSADGIKGWIDLNQESNAQVGRQFENVAGNGYIKMNGWDYFWVQYEEQLQSGNNKASLVPRAGFVEKVYESANLNAIFGYASTSSNTEFSTEFSSEFG